MNKEFNSQREIQGPPLTKEGEIKWYDEIPEQGVLCKCWDDFKEDYTIDIIIKYWRCDDVHFPFESKNLVFKHAIPLTYEDVEMWIYKGCITKIEIIK